MNRLHIYSNFFVQTILLPAIFTCSRLDAGDFQQTKLFHRLGWCYIHVHVYTLSLECNICLCPELIDGGGSISV